MANKATKANQVSFEIGACYVPANGGLPGLTEAEQQVFACLMANRADIAKAEHSFRVTRLAIAGAIAWEMLNNPREGPLSAVGYGKVHLFDVSKRRAQAGFERGSLIGGLAGPVGRVVGGAVGAAIMGIKFDTIARQTEEAGYLPKQDYDTRKILLSTPPGAIRYIGGIMSAVADTATKNGFRDIRNDPEILTNVYQSMDLKEWDKHLKEKPKGAALRGGNSMDIWVVDNLDYLTAAVGAAHVPEAPSIEQQTAPTSKTK